MKDNRLLQKLELESFKSIVQLDQELGQLTVLVGENSAGKSSVIQSIVLASEISTSGCSSAEVPLNSEVLAMGDFGQLVHSGAFGSDHVTVRLHFGRPGFTSAQWAAQHGVQWMFSLSKAKSSGALLTRSQLTGPSDEIAVYLIEDEDDARGSRKQALVDMLETSIALDIDTLGRELRKSADLARKGLGLFAAVQRRQLQHRNFELATMEGALPSRLWSHQGLRFKATEHYVEQVAGRSNWGDDDLRIFDDEAAGAADELEADYVEFLKRVQELKPRKSIESLTTSEVYNPEEMSIDALHELLMQVDLSGTDFVDRDILDEGSFGPLPLTGFVRDALAEKVHVLGPLRTDPSPSVRPGFSGRGIATLGLKGEFTVNYLEDHRDDEVLCPRTDGASPKPMRLEKAVAYWLSELGIGDRLITKQRGRQLEYDLVDWQTKKPRDLTSVGVGASQILPVIVICLLAKPGELVLLEQPELHLHPKPQQILGDFLLGISQTGRQLLVETHSEYLVNRLRLRMVEQELDEDLIALKILYAKRRDGATTFDEIHANKHGLFEGGWPEGFFDQSPTEAEDIIRAAVERRRRDRASSNKVDSSKEEI